MEFFESETRSCLFSEGAKSLVPQLFEKILKKDLTSKIQKIHV